MRGRVAGGAPGPLSSQASRPITGRVPTEESSHDPFGLLEHVATSLGRHFYTYVFNPDGTFETIFEIGAAWETFLGGPIPEGVDDDAAWVAAVHPDDRELYERLDEPIRRGEPVDAQYRLIGTDGRVRWVEVHERARSRAATAGSWWTASSPTSRRARRPSSRWRRPCARPTGSRASTASPAPTTAATCTEVLEAELARAGRAASRSRLLLARHRPLQARQRPPRPRRRRRGAARGRRGASRGRARVRHVAPLGRRGVRRPRCRPVDETRRCAPLGERLRRAIGSEPIRPLGRAGRRHRVGRRRLRRGRRTAPTSWSPPPTGRSTRRSAAAATGSAVQRGDERDSTATSPRPCALAQALALRRQRARAASRPSARRAGRRAGGARWPTRARLAARATCCLPARRLAARRRQGRRARPDADKAAPSTRTSGRSMRTHPRSARSWSGGSPGWRGRARGAPPPRAVRRHRLPGRPARATRSRSRRASSPPWTRTARSPTTACSGRAGPHRCRGRAVR